MIPASDHLFVQGPRDRHGDVLRPEIDRCERSSGAPGGTTLALESVWHALAMPFPQDDLECIDRAKTVRIETSKPGGPVHSTIIWAVVEQGEVFVRSWRGAGARWYREALANPDVAIVVQKRRTAARAEPATDPDSVARASAGLEHKYAGDPAVRSMVREEILGTTLRIDA